MIVTKKALPRRTFLRGLGTMLSLPLLDAMVPPMTALAGTPAAPGRLRRLGFVYVPMGCDLPRWTPPGATTLDELSMILNPLAPVRRHVTAISPVIPDPGWGRGLSGGRRRMVPRGAGGWSLHAVGWWWWWWFQHPGEEI